MGKIQSNNKANDLVSFSHSKMYQPLLPRNTVSCHSSLPKLKSGLRLFRKPLRISKACVQGKNSLKKPGLNGKLRMCQCVFQ